MRVHQQPGFVLLNRPYSESSWICDLFTRDHGRVAVIAKGARRIKSPYRGSLLPFLPLLLSWTGKGELPTLIGAEIQRSDQFQFSADLKGDALICGFYCNELISYLLHRYDPHVRLFDAYMAIICDLYASDEDSYSLSLRRFEQAVIQETGYAVNFQLEADHKTPIQPELHYRFFPGQGFRACVADVKGAVSGQIVLSLDNVFSGKLNNRELSQGKQIMRTILAESLGTKNINSRTLFVRAR